MRSRESARFEAAASVEYHTGLDGRATFGVSSNLVRSSAWRSRSDASIEFLLLSDERPKVVIPVAPATAVLSVDTRRDSPALSVTCMRALRRGSSGASQIIALSEFFDDLARELARMEVASRSGRHTEGGLGLYSTADRLGHVHSRHRTAGRSGDGWLRTAETCRSMPASSSPWHRRCAGSSLIALPARPIDELRGMRDARESALCQVEGRRRSRRTPPAPHSGSPGR